MKKFMILLSFTISVFLVGCDNLFTELEITFFNMNRVAYTQMNIQMIGIPNNDNIEFTIKTDGSHQITKIKDETRFTYFDENKNVYELIDIDGEYYSYQLENIGDYELDISIIMELFLLSPQDFKLGDDGYYRPIIILYDFKDLKFTVVNGYIDEMSFILNLNNDDIETHISFSDINEMDLDFPEYTQFTKLEEAEYFLKEDNHSITLLADGFEMSLEDIFLSFDTANKYITINKDNTYFYYFPEENHFKLYLDSEFTLEEVDIVNYYQSSYITILNFEYINKYYESYMDNIEIDTEIQ